MSEHLKHDLLAGIAGLLFGFGLIISDMISPARVQGFLDIFGAWDPSLAFVMIGGISVTFLGFSFTKKQVRPFFADTFHWPTKRDIDKRLIFGAAIFGIGWGLIGICPGPAFAGFIARPLELGIFILSMLLFGFITEKVISK